LPGRISHRSATGPTDAIRPLSTEPGVRSSWIAVGVDTGQYRDRFRIDSVDQRVRKALEPDAAGVPSQNRVRVRVFSDSRCCDSDRCKKGSSERFALGSVPTVGTFDIGSGIGPNDDPHVTSFSRRRRTSSQGIPRGPSRSNSSRRRSSSWRWASVSGTSSSVRLSHNRSMSFNRCSGVSFSGSMAGSLMGAFSHTRQARVADTSVPPRVYRPTSADGEPRRRPSTLMSSSASGQWIPDPLPRSCQLPRWAGVA